MGKKKLTDISNDEVKVETQKNAEVEVKTEKPTTKKNAKDILIFMRKETFVSGMVLKHHMKYSLSQEIVDSIPAENYIAIRTK